jgi:hypothetical protein
MDPKKFYGINTRNKKVRAIDGYHSDDSVLASDSDKEHYFSTCQRVHYHSRKQ